MEIPQGASKIWVAMLLGDEDYGLDCLPLKILLSRLRLNAKFHPDPYSIDKSITELRGFFEKNQNLRSLQKDLEKIVKRY